jgi:ABC-type uncharacterized transport system ATPase subunit
MKVALGRAILHDPRHLLLDEPTNGLDVPTVRLLRALLKNLRDAGVCIVFSSGGDWLDRSAGLHRVHVWYARRKRAELASLQEVRRQLSRD